MKRLPWMMLVSMLASCGGRTDESELCVGPFCGTVLPDGGGMPCTESACDSSCLAAGYHVGA